ncbi:MAG: hypothetical protein WBD80_00570 [Xanthobacteraceae bacterium]
MGDPRPSPKVYVDPAAVATVNAPRRTYRRKNMNSTRSTAASTLYKRPLRSLRRLALLPAVAAIRPLISTVAGAGSSCLPLLKQNPPQPAMPRNHAFGIRTRLCSHSAVFGVFMIAKPAAFEGDSVFRRVGSAIGTVTVAAFVVFPTMALAQVNIDQGKSAAEIYSSVCTACHKTPRGLAAGKNSLMLSAFLREHYTASSGQASALAAYVLGAGGAEPTPKQKPEVDHARAEEPKAGEPRTATRAPARVAAKPDEDKRPKQQEAKREEHPASPPSAEKHEAAPESASRDAKPQTEDIAPTAHDEAVPVSAAPAPTPAANPSPVAAEPPNPVAKLEVTPTESTAAPAAEQQSEGTVVPRDHIPD